MKTRLNKKIATAVLAGLLTVSLLPMSSYACRKGGGGQGAGSGCAMKGGQKWKKGGSLGIWRNAQLVQTLGLSDEQVHKLKEADFTAREKKQTLRAEINSLHLKMDHAFSADKVDEDAVRKLSKKIAATKGQMIEQRVENRLTLQKILTPEQLTKLNSQRDQGRGFGMGNGMGNGGNPPCKMNGQGGGGKGMQKGQGRM
ncbi:MAG: Spy/CpxP family protein refolding chaperone [Candidatus Electrothrix aestuarii]|uniref:Spy/CpxP family protein refolding chaperone n=1 Tax=Candidatus Electrothrix aestuarii TaxID=3062594 RepID=A0AAU8LWN3_9BACT|nr:Spy/CpxP family protein refolding chaperone [Candidatus Electrothrix aestuarii]